MILGIQAIRQWAAIALPPLAGRLSHSLCSWALAGRLAVVVLVVMLVVVVVVVALLLLIAVIVQGICKYLICSHSRIAQIRNCRILSANCRTVLGINCHLRVIWI